MAEILVNGQPWHYKETSYATCGSDILNHDDAKYILLTAKRILEKKGVIFMPMFGSLLGIIRENSFIKNDHDMDLAIFEKDKDILINSIPEFSKHGIEFTRASEPFVYTFQYKNAACDFYPLCKAKWPYSQRYYRFVGKFINKKFFKETEEIRFLDEIFYVPKNPVRLLEYFYGKNWRVPQKGRPARIQSKLLIHINLYWFIKRALGYIKRHYLN